MEFNITRTYVPMNEKMDSIMRVLSASLDQVTGTYKVGTVMVFQAIELAKLYTDIQLPEDPVEAFDMLAKEGIDFHLTSGEHEASQDIVRYNFLLDKQIEKLERYQNSIYGILDSIKNDYNNLDFDAEAIKKKLAKAEGLETVKTIVEKLG